MQIQLSCQLFARYRDVFPFACAIYFNSFLFHFVLLFSCVCVSVCECCLSSLGSVWCTLCVFNEHLPWRRFGLRLPKCLAFGPIAIDQLWLNHNPCHCCCCYCCCYCCSCCRCCCCCCGQLLAYLQCKQKPKDFCFNLVSFRFPSPVFLLHLQRSLSAIWQPAYNWQFKASHKAHI